MNPITTITQPTCFVFRFVTSMEDLKQSFDIVGRQFAPPITHVDRQFTDLESTFPSDQSLMIVVCADNSVVGGVFGFGSTMRLIAVAPSVRGLGVGRRLVEIFEIQAMQRGVRMISLGSVEEAKGFYHHMGYRGKTSMHKELPLPSRLLDLKLKRWSEKLGDLSSGHTAWVDEQSGQIPSLF
ncbi:GNAT family N-acetyltransferase [Chloroflexi bacterium TSY]|nr:GNAT family N-acetyltransferase [Chloroflexi bacterium TSY]